MNNESAVFAGLSQLIRQNVLAPLVQAIPTLVQQGRLNVDSMAEVLKLPAASSAPAAPASALPSVSGAPMMPGGFSMSSAGMMNPPSIMGFGGAPVQLTGAKRGKTAAPAAPVDPSRQCRYVRTRGKTPGQQCTNEMVGNTLLCVNCTKLKTAQQQISRLGAGAGLPSPVMSTLPSVSQLPGFPQFPTNMPVSQPVPQQRIQAVPTKIPGVYREVKHNLAIKAGTVPNEYICYGLMDPVTEAVSPLTVDLIKVCADMKLNYVDPNAGSQSTSSVSGQIIPNVNQSMPSVSGIPNVNQPMPSVSGLPNLSQGLGLPTLPQMPTLPGFGQNMTSPNMTGFSVPSVSEMRGMDDPADDGGDDGSDGDDA
mgnify:FL=1